MKSFMKRNARVFVLFTILIAIASFIANSLLNSVAATWTSYAHTVAVLKNVGFFFWTFLTLFLFVAGVIYLEGEEHLLTCFAGAFFFYSLFYLYDDYVLQLFGGSMLLFMKNAEPTLRITFGVLALVIFASALPIVFNPKKEPHNENL